MSMLEAITTGITGVVCAAFLVYLTVNFTKAGWMGKISRFLSNAKSKEVYGSRVLLTAVCISAIVNFIQWGAMISLGEAVSIWMMMLRIILCALLASGGYEYVKMIVNNLPK